MEHSTILKNLQSLNDLLIKERVAITKLDMNRLKVLQQEKTALLYLIREDGTELDEECLTITTKIRKSNKRNSWLLRHGLKVVKKLRSINLTKQTLTYNPHGTSLNFDGGPRLLTRRF